MKAMVYSRYGPPEVLGLTDVEKPTPGDGRVLVRVHAASANAGDWHLLRGSPLMVRMMSGLFRPRNGILGVDVAGTVEAIGANAKRFKPGDEVFGDIYENSETGAFAEYVSVNEKALALKPANLTFEQAAAAPSAGLTALQGLRNQGRVQAGERVLINGASGGVGTFGVQIAKALGAEVTGVCSSRNVDMVRSIGADHVIDYTGEDFTRNGVQYDVILDTAAYRPLSEYRGSLSPTGRYILVGGSGAQFLRVALTGPWLSRKGGRRFGTFLKKATIADLEFLRGLLEAGKVVPVIDRRLTLHEVPEALRYMEEGHTRGKVVITVGDQS